MTDYDREFGDFDTLEEAREKFNEAVHEVEDNLDEFFCDDEIEGQREYHCYRTFNDMYNSTFLFTKENIIRYVNCLFECNFNEMETISRSDERWVGNNKQVIKSNYKKEIKNEFNNE